MASTTDDTRDGLLRAEYGVENDTYYYLGTQWVARKRSGLRPDLIFLSGFEALLPRALAKRLVEALVGLKSGGESVTWFLTDHLGSNIATVDAAGAVIERSQFAPYGERWGKVAERGPGFTGHYEDQSTLTYMKARYYGGIVGRFLSPDPVLTDTADGGNFNRYWYANNNPQKFVDPDGRQALDHSSKYHTEYLNCASTPSCDIQGVPGRIAERERWAATGAGLLIPADRALSGALKVVGFYRAAYLTRVSVATKLEKYLLNPTHPVGGTKANWFRQALGFTQENLGDLARQIKFDPSKAIETGVTDYGIKYNQTIAISGANGKTIDVTFAWIKSAKDDVVRLVTAVPPKK